MSKRGENIYKRKDGRWEGRLKIVDFSTGRTRYKSFYGKTYKEVRKKMDDYKKAMQGSGSRAFASGMLTVK